MGHLCSAFAVHDGAEDAEDQSPQVPKQKKDEKKLKRLPDSQGFTKLSHRRSAIFTELLDPNVKGMPLATEFQCIFQVKQQKQQISRTFIIGDRCLVRFCETCMIQRVGFAALAAVLDTNRYRTIPSMLLPMKLVQHLRPEVPGDSGSMKTKTLAVICQKVGFAVQRDSSNVRLDTSHSFLSFLGLGPCLGKS